LQAELQSWLIAAGYPTSIELTPLRGDFGSTQMWVLSSPQHSSPLVGRVFSKVGDRGADREARAMAAAASNGVPVPEVFTRGEIEGRPLLVTTFIEGSPAARALGDLGNPYAFGVTVGEILGRINEVTAPDNLHESPHDWLSWGGDAMPRLEHLLTALPNRDRLLHFDYHLLNIMVHDGQVTGVIDWENATAGPPHMDLARSRAILRMAMLGNLASGVQPEQIAEFDRGLVDGHARVIGPDPFPELSTAWGLSMTVYDLSRHLGKPGNRIPEALIQQLAEERDTAIQHALARHEAGN
jgi:aminoglycoside phosphotransferase